jgi:hypothetical protein
MLLLCHNPKEVSMIRSLMRSFSNALSQRTTCCSICGNPVSLEASKTDEQGMAVHEECYVGRTVVLATAQQQAQLSRISVFDFLLLQ